MKIDVEVFDSGESLLEFIKKEHGFDLIFLDIEIGTTTDIVVGRKIRSELDDYISKIVFISSKEGYERKLFDIHCLRDNLVVKIKLNTAEFLQTQY